MTKVMDATRDEMVTFCDAIAVDATSDEFDYEEAIYWFASEYHGGQWTNLYAALCASPFRPSILARQVNRDGMAGWFYDELVRHFVNDEIGD